MNASFVLAGRPIVASAIPVGGAGRIADIEPFWARTLGREPKLFPHFGKAGTAIFLIKEIQYGGHDLDPVV
jgi:hypothetical protein